MAAAGGEGVEGRKQGGGEGNLQGGAGKRGRGNPLGETGRQQGGVRRRAGAR